MSESCTAIVLGEDGAETECSYLLDKDGWCLGLAGHLELPSVDDLRDRLIDLSRTEREGVGRTYPDEWQSVWDALDTAMNLEGEPPVPWRSDETWFDFVLLGLAKTMGLSPETTVEGLEAEVRALVAVRDAAGLPGPLSVPPPEVSP